MLTNKSSRHSKITGDFAESLVLYWLSKYGFECAKVDHTGIDLIARNPSNNELMGISVKSRSRNTGKERTTFGIDNDNFDKVEFACRSFACLPYFALVIDEYDEITIYIVSMKRFLELFPKGKSNAIWKTSHKYMRLINEDKEVKRIKFKHETMNWW